MSDRVTLKEALHEELADLDPSSSSALHRVVLLAAQFIAEPLWCLVDLLREITDRNAADDDGLNTVVLESSGLPLAESKEA